MEREMKKKIKNVMKTVETKASPSPSSPAPAPARGSREMARSVFEDNEKKLLGKGLPSPPLPACFLSCFPPRPNETPSSCPSGSPLFVPSLLLSVQHSLQAPSPLLLTSGQSAT